MGKLTAPVEMKGALSSMPGTCTDYIPGPEDQTSDPGGTSPDLSLRDGDDDLAPDVLACEVGHRLRGVVELVGGADLHP